MPVLHLRQQARCLFYTLLPPAPDSQFPIPDSRFPIPDSQFPIPDSRFPIPDSRFPILNSRIPCSLLPTPYSLCDMNILTDLVKALLRYQGRDWQSFDPITLRKAGMPGVEPDACFYIQNYQAILGKRRLDLSQDPPPDLALEIDLTSITDINDYIPLAVPEVWIYKADTIHIYRFESSRYLEVQTSQIFPNFPVKETIPQYINRAWQFGSSVALREFVGLLGEEGSRESGVGNRE
ncbi:Uma2 family endonuclease [Moorena sp. SIO1F2]|uniref:Uma2 family endonuclease n=1 Tax=Moorena sp. SIO1F2 TaxID=2607819 RepID=UPI0025D0F29D|nr:Uma2 family endonuclease [Moorena sp. SIO1F2]